MNQVQGSVNKINACNIGERWTKPRYLILAGASLQTDPNLFRSTRIINAIMGGANVIMAHHFVHRCMCLEIHVCGVHIKMRGPGSVELGESKLNLWRFGHFCTHACMHLVETHTIVLEDILKLVR